jgi:parallel beta-helix repeat protein
MNRARNLRNVSIERNRIEGRGERDSDFEDMINFYSASGASDDYIRVVGNYLRDGGPSPTGTGIIVGDGGGSSDSENILVEGNTFLDTGDVGINVAGGKNFIVKNNIVLGSHTNTSGDAVGFIINHYKYTPACSGHIIEGNRVYWRNTQPWEGVVRAGGVNHIWNTGTCQVTERNNTWGDASLKIEDIWPF